MATPTIPSPFKAHAMTLFNTALRACALALCLLPLAAIHPAQALDRPLLQDGKQSLYQRVLSRPKALLYSQSQSNGPVASDIRNLPAFTLLYVYNKQSGSNGQWLQVGKDSQGQSLGWIAQNQTVAWKQALTLSFKDPIKQNRVLLFKDRDSLRQLIDQGDSKAYQTLYQQAIDKQLPPDSSVVSISPAAAIDIKKRFYLVPITDYEERFLGAEKTRLLQISSIPLPEQRSPSSPANHKATQEGQQAQDPGFQTGVMFVVDATASMGPYIQRTRQAVRQIFNQLRADQGQSQLRFGLVAYRDSLDAAPSLQYLDKTFATLDQGRDAQAFLKRVQSVQAARSSSRGFIEDAYAGIQTAINDAGWDKLNARYLILITDAGPREANDPFSGTGLSTDALRQIAQDNNIALIVLHLKTPAGKNDHARAERLYRQLSQYPDLGALYYGVDLGDLNDFGRTLDNLSAQLIDQLDNARRLSQTASSMPTNASTAADTSNNSANKDQALQDKIRLLGNALTLRYLQQRQGEKAPDIFQAWLADRDLAHPEKTAVDVRLLLTRDQLSDLQSVLKRVLDTAEEGVLSPANFLDDLRSLAASVSRDPNAVASHTRATAANAKNLADMGYMREYLEDLPYSGGIMSTSLDQWETWPASQQLQFINRLEAKIRYYQALHDNTDLWVALDGGAITGDAVFPMTLDQLP